MILVLALVAVVIPFAAVGASSKYEVFEDKVFVELVTKTCASNGAEDKVPQVLDAFENLEKCAEKLFKDEVLLAEVAAAIRSGDLNGVYKQYCVRVPELKTCSYKLLDNLALCAGINSDIVGARNALEQFFGFVCHNDGERIALFIQEGGPQCYQQNSERLGRCGRLVANFDTNLSLSLRCEAFNRLSNCVVSALKDCSPSTPANMTQQLFASVRQATSCEEEKVLSRFTRWLGNRSQFD